jgi:hypothetical protein
MLIQHFLEKCMLVYRFLNNVGSTFFWKIIDSTFQKKNVDSENIDKLFSKNVDNISENVDQHFLVHEKY